MKDILDLLRKEARLTDAEIAQRLGRTESDVRDSIHSLEKEGVILGYQAIVNPEKSGDGALVGIIEVKLTPARDTGFDAIARRIYNFPEVKLCYLLSGGYDLLVFVEGKTLQDVANFVARKLATIDNVTSTSTHFILKKYKEAGISLTELEQGERLPVAP